MQDQDIIALEQEEAESHSPYFLKCHTCGKRLVLQDQFLQTRDYECPDSHAKISWHNNQIIGYTIFWDADSDANERYKLVAANGITTLFLSNNRQGKYWRVSYSPILDMDRMLTLEIKENTIVVNNLVRRLQKLKAFT
jgi:hypothetical protein